MAHPSPPSRPSSAPPKLDPPALSADGLRNSQPYREPGIDNQRLVIARHAPQWQRDLNRCG